MRILLVSNMYPSERRPDYGIFVQRLERALRARGHEVEPAVLHARSGGRLTSPVRYLRLAAGARRRAQAFDPDVVYAHYLVPTGVAAVLTRRPFVVTAHGGDVANAERDRLVRAVTRWVIRRAGAVVCVSEYLAERLPADPVRLEVIDCGVDSSRIAALPRMAGEGPRFLFVGSLTERKNVGRLVEAFAQLGRGSLTITGSGPLEERLRAAAPDGVRFTGRLHPERLWELYAAHDVICQPSLVEPQGQALLEALATGRPVVATRVGGPREYVTAECGVLVDPLDVRSIANGMNTAAALPVPCEAAVAVARAHDVAVQAAHIEALLAAISSANGAAVGSAP